MNKIAATALTLPFILLGALVCTLLTVLLKRLQKGKRMAPSLILERLKLRGVDVDSILKLPHRAFAIPLTDGSEINATIFPGNSDTAVILCHGIERDQESTFKFIPLWNERGITTVSISFNHGSGGAATFGVDESHQLEEAMTWLMKQYPNIRRWGIHGESMGGATALITSGRNTLPSFIVADSAFTSMKEMIRVNLRKSHVPRILDPILLSLVMPIHRILKGYSLKDASPLASLETISCPVLFIHGTEDSTTPYEMSQKHHERFDDSGHSFFCSFQGSGHVRGILDYPNEYAEAVDRLLYSAGVSPMVAM